jgi:hypothetical protein
MADIGIALALACHDGRAITRICDLATRQPEGRTDQRGCLTRAPLLLSLDFVYTPTADVDLAVTRAIETLGAELVWKVRAMGTVVACLRASDTGPFILFADHLKGETPVFVYRVADYDAAVRHLRETGVRDIRELQIPHGPCASFRLDDGQRYAVYELVRPGIDAHFAGRIDP